MKKIKLNILLMILSVVLGVVFYQKHNMDYFGFCSGMLLALLNGFFVYFNVVKIGSGTNTVLKYMLQLLFIRMPVIAGLMYLLIVVLKAGLAGFAAGIAVGFVFGMYRIAKPGNFPVKQENV